MKPKMTWIEELYLKRRSLFSTTVVVETNDDKRPQELVLSLESEGKKVIVWDLYRGMFRREGGRELPLQAAQSQGNDFLSSLGAGGGNPIKDLDELLRSERDLTVVIKNVLKNDDLDMKALNLWAMDDDLFSRNHTIVIFTPTREFVDGYVLDKQVLIVPPLSLPDERRAILNRILNETNVSLDSKQVDAMVALGGGLDKCKAEAVYVETLMAYAMGGFKELDLSIVANNKAAIIKKTKVLDVLMEQPFGFEGVGGYDVLKEYIRQNIIAPVQDKERADALGVEQPKGFIMFGPGGTGKSLFARSLAKELGFPFISLKQENFMTSYVGESERNLKRALEIIDGMAPNVVFIDEIDRLGGRGDSPEQDGGGTTYRIFAMLLEWLGGPTRNSIVIGATNLPYLDAAFRREGRFDMLVPMLSPDREARRQILDVHLNVVRKVKHRLSEQVLDRIADETEHWKGNQLEELVKRATRTAFRKGKSLVEDEDILEAKEDFIINVKALAEDESKYLKMANELCNSKAFINALGRTTGVGEGAVAAGRDAILRSIVKGQEG